ncbi:MAG TPA: hypothetical protein VGN34_28810, partial [Ktedonobacteraceae bacterium]
DGAGKSFLCKQICEKFNLPMGDRAEKDRDKIYQTTRRDTANAFHAEMLCTGPSQVWDRLGPWSDPIYSRYAIPHRDCAFTMAEINSYYYIARRLGFVILCLPPLHVVRDNIEDTHQLKGVHENIDAIYGEYQLLRGLRYDYTREDALDWVLQRVVDYLDDRVERRARATGS